MRKGNRKGVEEFWNINSFKNEMLKTLVKEKESVSAKETSNFVENGKAQTQSINIMRGLKEYRIPVTSRDII